MKILVIDDSPIHRASANVLITAGHDVTIVGTYDDADAALQPQLFDAVLIDLMMPGSRQKQGPIGRQFVGQEMPLGTILALLALRVGVKYVAVITDTNHHDHPASAAFDAFPESDSFAVGDAKILCTNHLAGWVAIDTTTMEIVPDNFAESEEGQKKYPPIEGGYGKRIGLAYGKHWLKELERLLRVTSSNDD